MATKAKGCFPLATPAPVSGFEYSAPGPTREFSMSSACVGSRASAHSGIQVKARRAQGCFPLSAPVSAVHYLAPGQTREF